MGGLANTLAAHMDYDSPGARDRVARFWETEAVADGPGMKAVDLFDAVERGDIKVLWIMATNPAVSLPETHRIRRALDLCPTVIVSDCVRNTDTASHADILLPAAGWVRKTARLPTPNAAFPVNGAFCRCPERPGRTGGSSVRWPAPWDTRRGLTMSVLRTFSGNMPGCRDSRTPVNVSSIYPDWRI